MKKIISFLFFFLAAGVIIFLVLYPKLKEAGKAEKIESFEDCAAAGYPIMESYPRQCSAAGGRVFIENFLPER